LVYSEFVLYKGTTFYHINSAESIDTFYSLRTDLDKYERACEITKVVNSLVYENIEANGILSLYLNTLFVISKKDLPFNYVKSVFKLKILSLLGYSPSITRCSNCSSSMVEKEDKGYYYSFNTNSVLCGNCYTKLSKENEQKLKSGWYIKLSQATYYAIYYVLASDSKKVYSFRIDDKTEEELSKIADRLYIEQLSF
jgi:DNA repair protein RecO (recombination protein O)